MNINCDSLKEKLDNAYELLKKTIKKPNILIVGGTGVGKSSLVNVCFGKDIAEVGVGKPVTKNMSAYEISDIPIVLFDTKGYEIGSDKEKLFLDEVVNYAIENKGESNKQIHIIWYCIQASGHRVLTFDKEILAKLHQAGVPISVVFTKCDLVTENEIEKIKDEVFNSTPNIPGFKITVKKENGYFDLVKLCNWSIENLPAGLRFAFITAQKVNLAAKRNEAIIVFLQHTGGSAFVGFVPIPFSDAPILLTNQAAMFARIIFIYDMQSLLATSRGLIGGLGLPTLISSTGIWLVGQLAKLIPGIGTVVGGVISGAVAASLTAAIGFAISEICSRIYRLVIDGKAQQLEELLQNVDTIFENLVKENFKKGKTNLLNETDTK